MPVLSARDLDKAYGTRLLLDKVTLTIRRNERVGLLGVNGAGKTTLLRVLAGLEPPDTGDVERRRGANIVYLSQEPRLEADKNALDIVLEASRESRAGEVREPMETHVAEAMLDKLGVHDFTQKAGTMSGGEKRRVALARTLSLAPDLAILDEPTNHLDTDTIEWLEEYLLREFRGSVLMVTHDRYVLDTVCDRILELANGKIYEYVGSYGDYLEKKIEREMHDERVEQNRQNLIRREKAWLMRGAKARSTKQKARIQRAEAVMAQEGPRAQESIDVQVTTAPRLGKTVLELHDATIEIGGRTLIKDLTLHLRGGERLGVIGPNGAGKTTLLRAIEGKLAPKSGTIVRGAQTKLAIFDQNRANLREDWTIVENVVEREGAHRTGAGVVTFGEETLEARTYLERFLFDSHKQMQKVAALSGGERARVALAKVLIAGANVLIFDEPTNDLDVSTLSALEGMLDAWPGAAIIVSHDRWFLDRTATSILAFEGEGRCVQYQGNFSQYRGLKAEAERAKEEEEKSKRREKEGRGKSEAPGAASASAPISPTEKALTYGERIELDGILDVIDRAEQELTRLDAALADPTLYSARGAEVPKTQEAHAKAKAEVARLTARWESLEARRAIKK